MEKHFYLLFFIFLSIHSAAQEICDRIDQTERIKKYNIKKFKMSVNDVIVKESIYNENGLEILHRNYSYISDSNIIIDSKENFYFKRRYNKLGNIIESIQYFTKDSTSLYKSKFLYDENNNLIHIEKFSMTKKYFDDWESRMEKGDSFFNRAVNYYFWKHGVDINYYYDDTLLIKHTFQSSIDSTITIYQYDGNKNLIKMIDTDRELKNDTTFVEYTTDTTYYLRYDADGYKCLIDYMITDNEGRVKEKYFWRRGVSDYGYRYFYDKRGLIKREEQFSNDGRGVLEVYKYTYE